MYGEKRKTARAFKQILDPQLLSTVSALIQGKAQALDEIRFILNAARYANEPIRDADLKTVLLKHVRVSHDCAGGDDALGSTKIFTQAPGPLNCVHQLGACI